MESKDALKKEIIELFVDLAGMLGLPPSYGEIYGVLYIAERPLGFGEIGERLGLSKGSVSMGLRALRGVGAVKVVSAEEAIQHALGPLAKGLELPAPFLRGAAMRMDYYVPEIDLRMLMAGFLRQTIEPQLKRGLARVGDMRTRHAKLFAESNGATALLHERLEKLDSWHRKGGTLLPMIAKVLG